jgi:hypothetical protein
MKVNFLLDSDLGCWGFGVLLFLREQYDYQVEFVLGPLRFRFWFL